jgi:protocatechuate 3,4-dioxygenase, alpha subunit
MGEPLPATPGQTVGPFFGFALPYARGGELVPPARPDAVRLHGVVYDGRGAPVPDAMVEIRQSDPSGAVPVVEGSLRRDGTAFTGWGRTDTDASGRYSFTTVEPGPTRPGGAAFFAVVVFARGLLDGLFTRAYLPEGAEADPFLAAVDSERRPRLIAVREESRCLRFDLHLQGPEESVFLTFSGDDGGDE